MHRIVTRTYHVPKVLRTCSCRYMSSKPDGGDGDKQEPASIEKPSKPADTLGRATQDPAVPDTSDGDQTEKPPGKILGAFVKAMQHKISDVKEQVEETSAEEKPKGTILSAFEKAMQHKISSQERQGQEAQSLQKQESKQHKDKLLHATPLDTVLNRPTFRTSQNDPTKHTMKQDGLFYTIPKDEWSRWMKEGLVPDFYLAVKAFNETCLMVREPAVEIMECMRAANYDYPVIRYLLYGRPGSGKSTTLAHLMHFCGVQNWMVIHIPWAALIHRYAKDIIPSTHRKGRLDQPTEAAKWLAYFVHVNGPLLKSLEIKTTGSYVYSKRESFEEGGPLTDMIDFGLQRTKYATDVMGAVVKEMKIQASARKFQMLVAIDGVNALWEQSTYITEESRHKFHHAQDLSMVQHIMKLLQNDWTGGAVICTADKNASHEHWKNYTSHMPRFLLGEKGFEFLDPFIPIHVPDYSEKEVHSCLDYFVDRRWIQNPAGFTNEGRKEIIFLSSKNPLEVYKVTRRW